MSRISRNVGYAREHIAEQETRWKTYVRMSTEAKRNGG